MLQNCLFLLKYFVENIALRRKQNTGIRTSISDRATEVILLKVERLLRSPWQQTASVLLFGVPFVFFMHQWNLLSPYSDNTVLDIGLMVLRHTGILFNR